MNTLQSAALAAVTAVLTERNRQVEAEDFSLEHDDQHTSGELAMAAACYAATAAEQAAGWDGPFSPSPGLWPWAPRDYKPKDQEANLVRAAALLLAEIERLYRARAREPIVEMEA